MKLNLNSLAKNISDQKIKIKGAVDKRLKAAVTDDRGFQSQQLELQGVAVTERQNCNYCIYAEIHSYLTTSNLIACNRKDLPN